MSEGSDRLTRIENAVMELVARTSTMQATLDAHIRQQTERTANRDRRCDDHEVRIRALDDAGADEHGGQIAAMQEEIRALREWRIKLVGMAAAVATLVSTPLGAAGLAIAQAAKK